MKTTIDIPEKLLTQTIKHTGTKSKRDAVVTAVSEFNRRRLLAALAERLQGSCPDFMMQTGFRQMRQDHKWEAAR